MEKKETVHFILEKLFIKLSENKFGTAFTRRLPTMSNLTLIQPIMFDSQKLSIGLCRESYVSHFYLFDCWDPYLNKNDHKKHKVIEIFAGKVKGILGPNQIFKNRLYPKADGKVDSHENFLPQIELVIKELNLIMKSVDIKHFKREIPMSEAVMLKPIRKEATKL